MILFRVGQGWHLLPTQKPWHTSRVNTCLRYFPWFSSPWCSPWALVVARETWGSSLVRCTMPFLCWIPRKFTRLAQLGRRASRFSSSGWFLRLRYEQTLHILFERQWTASDWFFVAGWKLHDWLCWILLFGFYCFCGGNLRDDRPLLYLWLPSLHAGYEVYVFHQAQSL